MSKTDAGNQTASYMLLRRTYKLYLGAYCYQLLKRESKNYSLIGLYSKHEANVLLEAKKKRLKILADATQEVKVKRRLS